MSDESVSDRIKHFLLREFLPGEDPNELTFATPLITGGILDSLATLKTVAFLEEAFAIRLEAHEVDVEHLNTISDMARLVLSKQQAASRGR